MVGADIGRALILATLPLAAWLHRLTLDQLYSARPMLGYGDYRAPVRGLYMCGSGTHPGGGVTGAPGHNAAHEILRDLRVRGARHLRARAAA